MKKFAFRLQPLLRLRQQQEEQKKRVLGSLLTLLHQEQRHILEMAQTLKKEGEKLKKQYLCGAVDLDWVGHYRLYVNHTQNAISERIKTVAQIQQKVAVARQDLAQAAKETKILEKLRERQKARYDVRLRRKEIVELDEIGTNVFLRSRRSA